MADMQNNWISFFITITWILFDRNTFCHMLIQQNGLAELDSNDFLSKSWRNASHINCNISTLTYNNMIVVMQYFT